MKLLTICCICVSVCASAQPPRGYGGEQLRIDFTGANVRDSSRSETYTSLADSTYTFLVKTTFDRSRNTRTTSYFDAANKFREDIKQFDNNGYLVDFAQYAGSVPISREHYTIGDKGRIIEERACEYTRYRSSPCCPQALLTIEGGAIIDYALFQDSMFSHFRFRYDEQGHVTEMSDTGITDGHLTAEKYTYAFDSGGNKTEEAISDVYPPDDGHPDFDYNGRRMSRKTAHTYNDSNKVTEEVRYYYNNSRLGPSSGTYLYTVVTESFDNLRHVTGRAMCDVYKQDDGAETKVCKELRH